MSLPIKETDICIIGAGPGGAAASLFLDKYGIDNVIVDKSGFPRDKICGDACSGKVVDTLKKINPEYAKEILGTDFQIDSWGVAFIAPNGKKLRVPFKIKFEKDDDPPGFISKRIDFDNYLVQKGEGMSAFNTY